MASHDSVFHARGTGTRQRSVSKKPADDVVDYAAPAQAAGIDLEPAWNEWLSLLEQSLKEGFADK